MQRSARRANTRKSWRGKKRSTKRKWHARNGNIGRKWDKADRVIDSERSQIIAFTSPLLRRTVRSQCINKVNSQFLVNVSGTRVNETSIWRTYVGHCLGQPELRPYRTLNRVGSGF